MQTVVETPGYLKAAESIFSVKEREEVVSMVAARPECGEVIRGTGGFGKSALPVLAWESAAGRV